MRTEWLGRSTGTACAVAGCMPMLFAVLAGLTGAAGAQGMDASMGMMPAAPMEPGWVAALGAVSWPLLVASVALLLWGFRRAAPLSRGLSAGGVALLVANQMAMTPWLFFPALALIVAALVVAGPRRTGPPARAVGAGEVFPPQGR